MFSPQSGMYMDMGGPNGDWTVKVWYHRHPVTGKLMVDQFVRRKPRDDNKTHRSPKET